MDEKARGRGRYFAEIFDADGLPYVFDSGNEGREIAGPFATLEDADSDAEIRNGEDA